MSERDDLESRAHKCIERFERKHKEGMESITEIQNIIALQDRIIGEKDYRIAQIEQQLAEREWISVEDKLPDNDVLVLIYSPDFGCDVSCLRATGGWDCDGSFGVPFGVTHWMPLPEPPKEGE